MSTTILRTLPIGEDTPITAPQDPTFEAELAVVLAQMAIPPYVHPREVGVRRLDRAADLVRGGKVTATGHEGIQVQGEHGLYRVTQEGCSCPSARKSGHPWCYHRIAAHLWDRLAARLAPRTRSSFFSTHIAPAAAVAPQALPPTARHDRKAIAMSDPFYLPEALPAVSFRETKPGEILALRVTGPAELVQGRDYDNNEPLFWEDGQPQMCAVVPVVLPSGEARALWCKKPSSLFLAVATAQKKADAGPLSAGGVLRITYVGEEKNKNPRKNPRKIYTAQYTPPEPVSAFDLPYEREPGEDDE